MTLNPFKNSVLSALFLVFSIAGFASDTKEDKSDKPFDPKDMIMHHVKDAHEFHIIDWNDKPISLSLPIILWTDNGLTTFSSGAFHHDDSGHTVVERNGGKFVKFHEKIYQLNSGETAVAFDKAHHPTNASKPLDFSITRNVFMMWVD